MPRRLLLSLLLAALTTSCAAGEPNSSGRHFDWPGSLSGQCFSSIDAYIAEEFPWTAEAPDENIRVSSLGAAGGPDQYFMVTDATSSINPPRKVLRVTGRDQDACVVLDAVYASSIDIAFFPNGSLPPEVVTVSTPAVGFPETRVTYRWSLASGRFFPELCQHIGVSSEAPVFEACESAFEQ